MEKKPAAKKSSKKSKNAPAKIAPKKASHKKDFLVVGLGASAGGVKALQEFFATMPPNSGMAFVAILHLSPEHESSLPQIIQAQTQMKVIQVTETVKVEPNNVYVIPPNRQLEMVDGVIRPAKAERPHGQRIAIDVFFRTLAEAYEKNAVCVVLSGTGSDGTLGLKRVKESNGFAIVQLPEDAEYDSMPRSAMGTQLADWVLPVHQMPEKLLHFKESSERLHLTNGADADQVGREIHAGESLREVLTLLRIRTGHDFSNYKMPTLIRRIARHLQIHELEDIPSYLELLRQKPEEVHSLLKNLLINVTNFFRDKEAFAAVEAEALPQIFDGKTSRDTVRVWSCGCASGEEPFSLAMLLSEYAETLPDPPKFQVFASDVDDEAISEARLSRYPEAIEADVSPERLKKFFTKEGKYYSIKKELRETVLFAPHNVLRDPPFSRLDLVVCRNLLIYLNRETQERVLQIFHFALGKNGYLFLGSSESAESVATMFSPVNKKQRLYARRSASVIAQMALPMMPVTGRWDVRLPESKPETARDRTATLSEIHYKLLENYAPASILVNQDFDIVYSSDAAGRFLRFVSGQPSPNLLKAVNPDLLPDLRAALFTAQREHKSSEFPNVRVKLVGGEETMINLIVRAVDGESEASDYLLVIFEEKNSPSAIRATDQKIEKIFDKDEAMEKVVRRLEEDLQRTKEQLRLTIEQHETTVEEHRAGNEELQATIEELRSASEELETSKEELQSVNEELTTVNHELKDKIDETGRVNSDLQNLMASTDIATIFLDRNLCIKRYTPPVEDFFNITKIDIGRPLEHFTHKLNYDDLSKDAARVLKNLMPIEKEISDKNNRHYLARFAPYRTIDDRIDGIVLNFIDVTSRKTAEEAVRLSEERLQKAINIDTVGVLFFNNEFEITDCNEAFARMTGYTCEELQAGRFSWQKFTPDGFLEVSSRALVEINTAGIATPYEKEYIRKDGTRFWALFAAKRIGKNEIVEFVTDITEQKQAEAALRESEVRRNLALEAAELGTFLYHPQEDRGEPDARMLALFGLEEGDALNLAEALDRMIHPGDREFYAAAVAKAVDPQGGGKLNVEIRVIHPDESLHWIAVTAQTIFEGAPPQPAGMYGTAADITERKRVETIQTFRLKLSDALRPLADPFAVQETAMQILGAHLDVNRAFYGEVLDDEDTIVFSPGYADGLPMLTGQAKFSEFDSDMMNDYRAGRTVVLTDIRADVNLTAKAKTEFDAIQIQAAVGVPLVKNNRVRAILSIHQSAPRNWTADEIKILEETAERTWAAVERAKAEEALSASEEKYRTLFNSIDEGVTTVEILFDENGKAVDLVYLEQTAMSMKLTGLDLVGKKASETLGGGIEPHWMELLAQVAATGEPLRTEYHVKDMGWFNTYLARVGGADSRKVISVFTDITERKRHEEKQAFLLKLSDALRPLADAEEIRLASATILGRHLKANRVAYAENVLEEEQFEVTQNYTDGAAEVTGRFRYADYGADILKQLQSGSIRVQPDIQNDSRLSDTEKRLLAEAEVGASLNVPLVKNKALVAFLGVNYATAHDFKPDEIELVKETAERTWAAVLRARAEAALRESEERLRDVLDSMTEGFALLDGDFTILDVNQETLRLDGRTRDELIGRSHWEAFPGTKNSPVGEIFRRVAREHVPGALEHEYRWSDEYSLWIDMRAYPTGDGGVAIFWRDFTDRRRAEEALRASEEKYRNLFDSIDEGFCTIEVLFDKKGKAIDYLFVETNPAFERQTALKNAAGKRMRELAPEHEEFWFEAYGQIAKTGEPMRFEHEAAALGKFYDVYAFRIGAAEENSVAIIFNDITERRRIEQAVRDSEERLRIAVEAAEMATWDWDLITNEVIWNERHFLLFGMKPSKKPLRPEAFSDHVHPDDREWVMKRLEQAVETNTTFTAEFRIICENGKIRWMEGYGHVVETENGKPTRMSGVMSDVTNRKRAEEAVRLSEERLQLIMRSISDYAIITSDTDGVINGWNTGAENTFGWTAKEAIGQPCALIFTLEDRAANVPQREMQTALENGVAEDTRWHIRKDGTRFFASGTVSPIKNGELDGFVKITSDQTARMEAETALREKETLQKLVTAQEDERKRIARDLHDELGQQLTALRIKLDAVSKDQTEPVLRNQLYEIQNIARSIDDGVDFLAWELRPTTLDDLGLTAAIEKYLQQWSHYSGVKAELTISNLKRARFAPEVETCLYRIVQEALNNTHKHAEATTADVILEKRGDMVILIIEDNGKGFNQKNKMNRSKGIGLIGMRERAALVGGTLDIETAPKQGTTIFVRIPFSAAKEKSGRTE